MKFCDTFMPAGHRVQYDYGVKIIVRILAQAKPEQNANNDLAS